MSRINQGLLDSLQKEILNWENDYRAESISAYLVNRGLNPEQIIIECIGSAKRSYRKEISSYKTEVSEYDNREYLFLQTNKEGIYDALPENIFHQPSRGKTKKNNQESIQEIQAHRQEQFEARRFFLPFEHGFNYVKLLTHLFEQDFEKINEKSALISVFSDQFEVLKKLNPYQAYVFFRLIPLIHQLRNNFDLVADCLEMILQVPFKLESQFGYLKESNFVSGAKLGECGLGSDMVTEGIVQDGESSIKISIGPIILSDIDLFILGGKNAIILDELLGYFIGANEEVAIKLIVSEETRLNSLSSNITLGINLYL